uniref:ATP synthase F0 subunit 8 n=1 Tax=Scolytinae sp. BMNH 1043133 TaxID=1903798 RepID=A0A343A4U0_9CUCU|nr:ATP synthase F0 subunit 8 [Scolytinae sp. BMNH 1043133]
MPQMSPLQWTSMYTFFTIMFIMIIVISYYMYSNMPMCQKSSKNKTMINWKW